MRLKHLVYSCILALFPVVQAAAQQAAAPSAINQHDDKGQQQGPWYVSHAARMGEPSYTEFGFYDHGRRLGLWYKMDEEGNLMSIEQYRNDVLDGEAKYFENGQLVCVGHYRGLNPAQKYDTIIVTNPLTGAEKLVSVSTDRGSLKHGMWRFYDSQTGRLLKEEEFQVDELISRKNFGLTKADSVYYQKRIQALPHNQKGADRPRRRKVNSNIGY